jgi:hypothetical protein
MEASVSLIVPEDVNVPAPETLASQYLAGFGDELKPGPSVPPAATSNASTLTLTVPDAFVVAVIVSKRLYMLFPTGKVYVPEVSDAGKVLSSGPFT